MGNLYGTVASYTPQYLLADNENADRIAVSIEPGNGTLTRGQVLYRKSGVLYAPAAAAQVTAANDLVILDEEVDTTESETVAQAAGAFRAGHMLAGKVKIANGAALADITAAQALVLRQQGIVIDPFDDWTGALREADNTVE